MLWGILTTIAVAGTSYTLYETNKSIELSEKAALKREKAVERENEANRRLNRIEKAAEASMTKLFHIRKGIYLTTLKNFHSVFEPISDLSFLQSLKNIDGKENLSLSPCLTDTGIMTTIYGKPMTKKQEICSILFGAAGIMRADKKESEKELAYAGKQMQLARLIEQNVDNKIMVLNTIIQKNDILWNLLKNLNVLLVTSLKENHRIIQLHGKKEDEYTNEELDNLRFSIQIADVLCKLGNASLIDGEGEFYSESKKLIETGNQIVEKGNEAIRERK